jgi:predicted MFS family arabinose efflux permease
VGVLLDRYGPRRTEASLLLVTGLGAFGFALGQSDDSLTVARGLMGLGVSACLMATLKYSTQVFPPERQASMTGLVMAAGGLGAVSSSLPLAALLPMTGWRPVFLALAVVSLVVAGAIFRSVRDPATGLNPQPLVRQLGSLTEVFATAVFWKFVPVAAFSVGGFMAVQGLWVVPWLMHVHGAARGEAAGYQLALCVAGLCGNLAIAGFATLLLRRGVSQMRLMIGGQLLAIVAQLVIVFVAGVSYLAWFALGVAASTGAQVYSLLASHYPLALTGRVMTSINLIVFVAAFAVQWGYGELVDLLTGSMGVANAYRAAYGTLIGLQAIGLLALLSATGAPQLAHRGPAADA